MYEVVIVLFEIYANNSNETRNDENNKKKKNFAL